MIIKTEGIVIRALDYGEGSKIITLYTRDYGKISLMAKGAKKPKSRFHGITQLFSYGVYIFYMTSQMGTLNQGDLQLYFTDIYRDIEKTAYAAYLVELVDKLTEPKEKNSFLFEQLLAGLEQINSGKDPEVIARLFEMKILHVSGYKPHIQSCSICGNQEQLTGFSVSHGGLICNRHEQTKSIILQAGTVKLLKIFEYLELRRLGNIEVKDSTKSQLNAVMQAFFEEYVGIKCKSKGFIEQLKKF